MNNLLVDNTGAAIGSTLILLPLLALVALWVWALTDAIRVPDDTGYRAGTKLPWVLVIALPGLVGAALYPAVGRPARRPAPARCLPGAHGERRQRRRCSWSCSLATCSATESPKATGRPPTRPAAGPPWPPT